MAQNLLHNTNISLLQSTTFVSDVLGAFHKINPKSPISFDLSFRL